MRTGAGNCPEFVSSLLSDCKVKEFTYYKHHLFMINFVLSTFTRYLIFTTLYAIEKESEKNNKQIVGFKNVTHNISDYFRLTSVSIFSTLYNKIL